MTTNKTWRNRIKNSNNPITEYAKCLCPSCYVLHCENRRKSRDTGDIKRHEKRFDEVNV
ncbi:MAG: hypothetical protein MUO73_05595 [Thermoplasmata archaeon]|nr:hypothetical protein [Thermoplasmata archaeon]